MKDIPFFTTENGAASLGLGQIPYRGEAYIRLQASDRPKELLAECVSFCRAVGAEHIYGTGIGIEKSYPLYTEIIRMERPALQIPPSAAVLRPVTQGELEDWRGIYNRRMEKVPGAAWMTERDAVRALADRFPCYIYEEESLLGIGLLCDRQVLALASLVSGGGSRILGALLDKIGPRATVLEVASANKKAVELYEAFGFVKKGILTAWYRIM